MSVMKYNKKPDQVDAILFEGGAPNGPDIVNWVLNGGGTAVWLDALGPVTLDDGTVIPGRDERLRLFSSSGVMTNAAPGDYVVKSNTEFSALKATVFEARYEVAD